MGPRSIDRGKVRRSDRVVDRETRLFLADKWPNLINLYVLQREVAKHLIHHGRTLIAEAEYDATNRVSLAARDS